MKKFAFLWVVLVLMAIQVGTLTTARADVVGHLTEVTGQVSLMKGGKLPAIPAKLQDGVEPGDVVRTKSASKALITFMDNSTITIAPESKVAIEAYMFEPAQEKRNAVFQLFQGLAYVVVNKVFKVQNPDFIVKTHTAVMGVRGTEFGIRLYPASSTILNFKGVLEVGNFSPEISGLSRKALKIAHSWGAGHISWINPVFLHAMEGATVAQNLPPAIFKVTDAITNSFWTGFNVSESRRDKGSNESAGTQMASTSGPAGSSGGTDTTPDPPPQPSFLSSPPANPPPPTLLPPTFTFSLAVISGIFTQSSPSGVLPVSFTAGGSAILQGYLATIFGSNYVATDSSTLTATLGTLPSTPFGTYSTTMTGSVSGNLGSTLTGNATMQSFYVYNANTVSNSYTILVRIDPSGQITYSYVGGSFNSLNSPAISGTSAGEGLAYPVPASPAEVAGPMMTMAASNSSTPLTAAPASAGDAIVDPPTTPGTSGFKGTAGTHRRFGHRRDFSSPQDRHGRFEPSRAATLNTPNPVATISSTGPMTRQCPTGSSGPMNPGFALTSAITDPDVPIPSARVGVGAGSRGDGGRLYGVLKGAHPPIPVGARVTPPGSLTATPAAPRPQ